MIILLRVTEPISLIADELVECLKGKREFRFDPKEIHIKRKK